MALIEKAQDFKFEDYREGQFGHDQFHQHERTVGMFKKLDDQQAGYDILVVPAQFGLLYRGRSDRRACEIFNVSEFGPGVFAVGIMLLVHPERLQHLDDLWLYCTGDVYNDYSHGYAELDRVPVFGFYGDRVGFGLESVRLPYDRYGSVSAFLPQ